MNKKYHRLTIVAREPSTDIWVADTDGNLVVKTTGVLDEKLLVGEYDIHFGQLVGNITPWRINLTKDVMFEEQSTKG